LANIAFESTENDIAQIFANCGRIESIKLPKNEEGQGRGFAFVDFSSAEEAQAAIGLNGTTVGDKQINVKAYEYRERKPRVAGERGGFRGGRGRGGYRGGRGGRGQAFEDKE